MILTALQIQGFSYISLLCVPTCTGHIIQDKQQTRVFSERRSITLAVIACIRYRVSVNREQTSLRVIKLPAAPRGPMTLEAVPQLLRERPFHWARRPGAWVLNIQTVGNPPVGELLQVFKGLAVVVCLDTAG